MNDNAGKAPELQPTFSELVLAFSSACLYYLGQGGVSAEPSNEVNWSLADQNYRYLVLLREKTDGNLTDEEKSLLSEVIADLQTRLADAANS